MQPFVNTLSDTMPRKKGKIEWNDREQRAAYKAAWHLSNLERLKAKAARRRVDKKREIKAQQRRWYVTNQERLKERMRDRYAADPELMRARNKSNYEKNRAARIAASKAWRLANPDVYRELCRLAAKRWRERNPEKQRALNRQNHAFREARYAAVPIGDRKVIRAFYEFVKTTSKIRCYWCEKPVPLGKRHVDHVIPLSRGGAHDIRNLCCSCNKCNNRKHAKMPSVFSGQMTIDEIVHRATK